MKNLVLALAVAAIAAVAAQSADACSMTGAPGRLQDKGVKEMWAQFSAPMSTKPVANVAPQADKLTKAAKTTN